jgi:NarL family two-component system response regulator LiaR
MDVMAVKEKIGVLVVDDHGVVREGLCSLISARPDMVVVGDASDGIEAVEKALATHPDVILMDLVMPRMGGIEAIVEIKRHHPEARILVLTSFDEDRRVYDAIKGGALGYLLKDSSSTDLIRAIQQVHRGELSLQPSIALKVVRGLNQPSDLPRTTEPLSAREEEVLRLVAHGLTDVEIAARLSISDRTVNKHVSSILGKLQVANRTQAALYAVRRGLTGPDTEGGLVDQ